MTAELCDRIKSAGISIFSIAFAVTNGGTQNMLRDCASGNNNYYDASDPAQLSAAFNSIGAKVAAVRLSKQSRVRKLHGIDCGPPAPTVSAHPASCYVWSPAP